MHLLVPLRIYHSHSMKPIKTSTERPVFELKGSVLTILVLHIRETDSTLLYPQLEKKIGQARSFFNNAPVLIDLSALEEERQQELDVFVLANMLRRLGLVPVGVRGSAACQHERVLQAGLGVLPAIRTEKTIAVPEDHQPAETQSPQDKQLSASSETGKASASLAIPTKVITLPVRSGQQVFAPQGDLVVLSSVNAGAEVLAAGNIHIYGALRGRAMAGINGDTTARIFSLQCNPELVAVAGDYMVNELLEEKLINQCVLISYEEGGLKLEKIGTFSPLP